MLTDSQHIIFETNNGSIIQCDDTERYIIRFHGDEIVLRPCSFFAFKRKIESVDISSWLIHDSPDLEIISMPHCDRIFVFDIWQILELKELLSGTFTMLSLNSLIHRQLVRAI